MALCLGPIRCTSDCSRYIDGSDSLRLLSDEPVSVGFARSCETSTRVPSATSYFRPPSVPNVVRSWRTDAAHQQSQNKVFGVSLDVPTWQAQSCSSRSQRGYPLLRGPALPSEHELMRGTLMSATFGSRVPAPLTEQHVETVQHRIHSLTRHAKRQCIECLPLVGKHSRHMCKTAFDDTYGLTGETDVPPCFNSGLGPV